MRRVLLVAFAYPPSTLIGARRAAGLAKHLPHFGWEVIVLTSSVGESKRPFARVIEAEYQNFSVSLKSMLGLDSNWTLQHQRNLPAVRALSELPLQARVLCYVRP